MSSEPNVTPQIREAAFRLLCLNHTFTSYISALGAHREQLTNPEILAFLDDAVCMLMTRYIINLLMKNASIRH